MAARRTISSPAVSVSHRSRAFSPREAVTTSTSGRSRSSTSSRRTSVSSRSNGPSKRSRAIGCWSASGAGIPVASIAVPPADTGARRARVASARGNGVRWTRTRARSNKERRCRTPAPSPRSSDRLPRAVSSGVRRSSDGSTPRSPRRPAVRWSCSSPVRAASASPASCTRPSRTSMTTSSTILLDCREVEPTRGRLDRRDRAGARVGDPASGAGGGGRADGRRRAAHGAGAGLLRAVRPARHVAARRVPSPSAGLRDHGDRRAGRPRGRG